MVLYNTVTKPLGYLNFLTSAAELEKPGRAPGSRKAVRRCVRRDRELPLPSVLTTGTLGAGAGLISQMKRQVCREKRFTKGRRGHEDGLWTQPSSPWLSVLGGHAAPGIQDTR